MLDAGRIGPYQHHLCTMREHGLVTCSVEAGTELAPLLVALVAGSNRIAVTLVSTGCEPTALWCDPCHIPTRSSPC